MIIGTAGHIDHGKSALVKALTGVETDRLPEEKKRGITIDLGFAALELAGVGTVGVIDVPGHEDFVHSMVAGASGIDLGLLVVAADEGIMPQTREHLQILSLLGIRRIVVALSKADLVDEEWLALLREEVLEFTGAYDVEVLDVVSCSVFTGDGLVPLRAALSAALAKAPARGSADVFRLPVDRSFTVRGTGTVVTGTVWSGTLGRDAQVRVLPGDRSARVRRIERHGKTAERAEPGNRTAIALAGIDVGEVPRGSIIVSDDSWRPTSLVEAVTWLGPAAATTLTPRSRVRLHVGASEVGARILVSSSTMTPGEKTLTRIGFDSAIAVRGGDRFVIRLPAPLGTVGGGFIVDPFARRRPLPTGADDPERLLDPAARLRWILDAAGSEGVAIADVPVRVGCALDVAAIIAEDGVIVKGSANLFAAEVVESAMAQVRMIIAEYELRSPLSPGVPAQTLRETLRGSAELADISIAEMARSGEIETDGPLVRRKGWTPTPTASDRAASTQLAHDICAGEHEPPSVTELVARYGSAVPALLKHLEREGRIVQVETDRYYDRVALARLVTRLREGLVPGQVYVPAQLRDMLGFSRKYLIPFLEFCDRNGVTERRGEGRMLRETAGALLDTPGTRS